MDDLAALLFKAVQSLPESERELVLRSLLDKALVADAPLPISSPMMWAHGRAWPQLGALHALRQLAAGNPLPDVATDIGVPAEMLAAALRHVAARSQGRERLAGVLERLAAGDTLAQIGPELASELEPTDSLVNALGAALMSRAALPGQLPPAATPGPLRTMPVRFPERQYERLKAWSEAHGFPMAVVVRGLVERFLDEQDRRAA